MSFIFSPPRLLLLLSLGFAALTPALSGAADHREANNAYQIGDYEAARGLYEEILADTSQLSTTLCYNLGNAYYRLDEFGPAALNYRRVLLMDPAHPEAQQNLRYLESRLGFLLFHRTPLRSFVAQYRPDDLLAVQILSILFFIIVVVSLVVFRPRKIVAAPLVILAVLLLMLGVSTLIGHRTAVGVQNDFTQYHIVTAADSRAHTAPSTSASPVIVLPPGSEVRVLHHRGAWSYTEIPDEIRGWVKSAHLQPLKPESFGAAEQGRPTQANSVTSRH